MQNSFGVIEKEIAGLKREKDKIRLKEKLMGVSEYSCIKIFTQVTSLTLDLLVGK
jgi:hypothetical protein